MLTAHPIWLAVVVACIAWYSTITLYVAIQGARDIRHMLRELKQRDSRE